jgi:hypothetical protein
MLGVVMLFKLLISHALCDFSLQTPWMAANKNRHNKPTDDALPAGQRLQLTWPYVLTAHALIHAGGAWIATERVEAAAGMFVSHLMLDAAKCEGWWNIHLDQLLHAVTLITIAALLTM